ncbi:unnamed protein product [Closterium sp. NIES-64]|nr:unnamed protein product [Closterium sp. NIES-64]
MRAVGTLAAVSSPRPGSTADRAGNMVADAVRKVEASGAAAHVHVSVTTEPPTAPVAVEVAPLRAPTLREYLPAAAARGPFRGRRQAPGYPAPQNTVGQTPGHVGMFLPRGVPTAPLPSRAGRDPTLSMCRMWNLAGAAEGLASLQLAACEAMPQHGTPVDTLRFSAKLLHSMAGCLLAMLEAEGAGLWCTCGLYYAWMAHDTWDGPLLDHPGQHGSDGGAAPHGGSALSALLLVDGN